MAKRHVKCTNNTKVLVILRNLIAHMGLVHVAGNTVNNCRECCATAVQLNRNYRNVLAELTQMYNPSTGVKRNKCLENIKYFLK